MTAQDDPFYAYYAHESAKPDTIVRFTATKEAVQRAAQAFSFPAGPWKVADIGCGAGTQCALWAKDGHSVFGLDINEQLVGLGKQRAQAANLNIDFSVGSATKLPWPSESMDIALCPELLEHVADWRSVVAEATRVLRKGGILYLSTTNKLCPVQEEFDLPGYSWYPGFMKRHYEKLSVTTRPELVQHAKYPAVNWFSYFGLSRYLRGLGFRSLDRFDVAALGAHSAAAKGVLATVRSVPPLRFLGHVFTPYTVVFALRLQ